jgi:hemolysin III
MTVPQGPAKQSEAEEVANSITHGVGLVLSSAGWAALMVLAYLFGDTWHLISCGIYGGTLVFLYAASTLYHSARKLRYKRVLRVVDHAAIFLLIAGSYTPFAMGALRDGFAWTLLTVVWGIALVGLLFKLFSRRRFHWSTSALYIIMGWMGVLLINPMLDVLPLGALLWVIAGGLAYTVGIIFYGWHALPYSHAIWHLFVLAGSIFHYIAVVLYVVPLGE